MTEYRERLPQLEGGLFLTDGGIETSLIFQQGLELPLFAAFDLLKDASGTEALRRYYRPYAELARDAGVGFVWESPTWRASADWGARLGYSDEALADANRRALELMHELRARYQTARSPMLVSGCLGPRGPGPRRRRSVRARRRIRRPAPPPPAALCARRLLRHRPAPRPPDPGGLRQLGEALAGSRTPGGPRTRA